MRKKREIYKEEDKIDTTKTDTLTIKKKIQNTTQTQARAASAEKIKIYLNEAAAQKKT